MDLSLERKDEDDQPVLGSKCLSKWFPHLFVREQFDHIMTILPLADYFCFGNAKKKCVCAFFFFKCPSEMK